MPDMRRWRSSARGPGQKRLYPLAADLAARGEGQAALRVTATGTDHAAAIRLAGAIWPLLGWRGCYEEQLTAARLGVRAARVSGDMVTEPRLHAGMGFVLRQLRRPGEAAGFCRAACLWLEAGRDDQFVAVLRELGHLSTARGRIPSSGASACATAPWCCSSTTPGHASRSRADREPRRRLRRELTGSVTPKRPMKTNTRRRPVQQSPGEVRGRLRS